MGRLSPPTLTETVDTSPLNLLFWPLSLGLWVLVLFLIVKHRHFATFPLLCGYLLFVMFFHLSAQVLSLYWGVGSPDYGLFYNLFLSLNFLLAAALYLRIYSLPDGLRWRRDWHFGAALLLVVVFQLLGTSEASYKLLNGGNLFCGYMGLATLFQTFSHRHRFHIGYTLGCAAIGLLLPSLVYGLVEVNFYFGFSLISLEDVMALARLTTIVFWLIMAYALSRNEEPRPARITRIDRKMARKRMWRNARELWGRSS